MADERQMLVSLSGRQWLLSKETVKKQKCMLEILSTLFESSAGSIQQSEFNIPPMWQRNFTSELSICWPFSRWVQVEVVCLHSQFTDGLCLELCLCIDEALFSNPPPPPWGELAMWWSLAVIYKRSISVVPVVAHRFLVKPNLACQLVRGFQASAMIQVICGSVFHFTQFKAVYGLS